MTERAGMENKSITPNDAINKAYDEYLDKQKETKEAIYREPIYCCGCKKDVSNYEYFGGLTDEEYLEEVDKNHLCGGTPRCMP